MKEIFRGSATAVITPFRNGQIDWDAYRNILEYQLQNGTSAIVAAGTTGEPATMTADEKREVISFAVKTVAGRVPVIAGTGSNSTAQAVASSKEAEELGADAVLVVTPYYNKTTSAGLKAHFWAVADAVNIPVIMYNVPSHTGLNMKPQDVAAIAKHPNIAAVKEASGSIQQVLEIRRLCPDLVIYSGTDEINYPVLCCGGSGSISVTANIAPKASAEMHKAFFDGDIASALEKHLALANLTRALFAETSPIPAKAAMHMLGFCEEELRLPLVPMSDELRPALRAAIEELGLL